MTKRDYDQRAAFERMLLDEVADTYEARQAARPLIALILRHGKTYARIQEMNCNGVGTWYGESNESFAKRQARHEAYCEKREQQLERRFTEICAELGPGFSPIFQGDPRGSTVKIKVPSGKSTDWDRTGVCVVTA